jgi:hypothetical protein
LFKKGGFKVIKKVYQKDFPDNLLKVVMFAIKEIEKN